MLPELSPVAQPQRRQQVNVIYNRTRFRSTYLKGRPHCKNKNSIHIRDSREKSLTNFFLNDLPENVAVLGLTPCQNHKKAS
jgi:hypothetical protein